MDAHSQRGFSIGRLRAAGAICLAAAGLAVGAASASATQVLQDGGFELATDSGVNGLNSPAWTEADTVYDTPICNLTACPATNGAKAYAGTNFAWFGGSKGAHTGSLAQAFTLPGASSGGTLSFYVWKFAFQEKSGALSVTIDGVPAYKIDTTTAAKLGNAYQVINIPLGALAAGTHNLVFEYKANGPALNSLLVDNIALDAIPSNAFTIDQIKRKAGNGSAKATAMLPGPGTLTLAGKSLKGADATATGPGPASVKVKAKGKAKKQLAKAGKAKVKGTLTFTPTGGAPAAQPVKVTLKRK